MIPASEDTTELIADTMASLRDVGALPAEDVAAAVDGHPLDGISSWKIPCVLRHICDPVRERAGGHGSYWYRRRP